MPHSPTPEWASVSCVNDKCEGQLRVVDEFFFFDGQRSGDPPPVFINCGPTRPVLSWWRDLSGSRRVARRQPEATLHMGRTPPVGGRGALMESCCHAGRRLEGTRALVVFTRSRSGCTELHCTGARGVLHILGTKLMRS